MGASSWMMGLALAGVAVWGIGPAQAETTPATLTGSAQAVGQVHTLRQIPEACVRLEGRFTGQAGQPYAMEVVPLPAPCQARARLEKASLISAAAGWTLTQRINVPSASCPGQVASFELWQRDGASPPTRDGQGQARIYLEQSRQQARAGQLARLPGYAARVQVSGRCPR